MKRGEARPCCAGITLWLLQRNSESLLAGISDD
jgi:hypothetical protein